LLRIRLTSGKNLGAARFYPCHPQAGKISEALDTFTGFAIGKPVVIEETFLLKCSPNEFEECIDGSKKHASG